MIGSMTGDHRRQLGALTLVATLAACRGAATPPTPVDDARGSARAAGSIAHPSAPAPPPPSRSPSPLFQPAAPPQPPPPPPRTTAVAIDEPRIALPRQESFKLLETGKGRKATLRYAFAAGTIASTVEARLSSRHLEGADFTAPTALPAMRDGFAITIEPDRPGKLALRALAGEAAEKTAQADAYLAPWRTLLQNRRITVTVDDRGGIATVAFDDDPTGARRARARDELIQRLLATIVPLPDEPVGTGASWRVVTILRQGPAYAKQTATYTLSSRSAAGWKLHVKLQRVGEEQRIADPSLPSGTTADLLALFRALEGDVEVDPRYPLIAGGSLAIESRLHVKLQPAGQAAIEHLFEDTGTVRFSRCRPAPAPASAAPSAPPDTSPSAPPARPASFAPCPDGFSRTR